MGWLTAQRWLECLGSAVLTAGVLSTAAAASSAAPDFADMNHVSWTARDGAPAAVSALAQTPDGTLWVGTQTGLFRFDGVQFTREQVRTGQIPLDVNVSSLYADPRGGLWIGSLFGGVFQLQDGKVSHFGESAGLPRRTVTVISRDADGVLWAATWNGLFRLTGSHWERVPLVNPHVPRSSSGAGDAVNGLVVDRDGTLWVATGDAVLFRRRGESGFSLWVETEYPSLLRVDAQGRAWLSAPTNVRLLAKGMLPIPMSQLGAAPHSDTQTGILLFDHDGVAWGISNSLLARFGQLESLLQPNAVPPVIQPQRWASGERLSGGRPLAWLQDREGNIWVGTDGGLDRFRENKFHRLSFSDSSLSSAALAPDPDGSLWIGTGDSGVLRLHDGTISKLGVLNEAGARSGVLMLRRAFDGTLFAGSRGELRRISPGRVDRVTGPFSDSPVALQSADVDSSGMLWLSAVGRAILNLKDGQWSTVSPSLGLLAEPALLVRALPGGGVWLGYTDSRLALVRNGTAHLFTGADRLAVGNVLDIEFDGEVTWIAGSAGLAAYSNGRFTSILDDDGQSFQGVSGLVRDGRGDMWLNVAEGVVRIPVASLPRRYDGGDVKVVVERFDFDDGLEGYAQSLRPIPTACATKDGRLWFARTKGLYWIDPEHVQRNDIPPGVGVSAIKADGRDYAIDELARLPAGTSNLEVDYYATSLRSPQRVHFAYRLEGFDTQWREVENRRRAFYTNLPPGRFRFMVRAFNEDGKQSRTDATAAFEIEPRIWQVWWFRTLIAASAVMVIWLLAATRLRQREERLRIRLEAQAKERERIARELHDTLLQGTQALVLNFQGLADDLPVNDARRMRMEASLDRAEEVIGEARERVLLLRSDARSASDVATSLRDAGEALADETGVRFRLVEQATQGSLNEEQWDEVRLLAREALANAFHHARASKVEVTLDAGPLWFELLVSDDGSGIEQEVLGAGGKPGHWGLTGMRERAKRIGGELHVDSGAGQGTVLRLLVPARGGGLIRYLLRTLGLTQGARKPDKESGTPDMACW